VRNTVKYSCKNTIVENYKMSIMVFLMIHFRRNFRFSGWRRRWFIVIVGRIKIHFWKRRKSQNRTFIVSFFNSPVTIVQFLDNSDLDERWSTFIILGLKKRRKCKMQNFISVLMIIIIWCLSNVISLKFIENWRSFSFFEREK